MMATTFTILSPGLRSCRSCFFAKQERSIDVFISEVAKPLFPHQLQVRELAQVETGIIGFPQQCGLSAIFDLSHFRGVILESPDPLSGAPINFLHSERQAVRRYMNQDSRGKDQVEKSIWIWNCKCRCLRERNPGEPFPGPSQCIALNLDAMQIGKSHGLEQQQLVAEVA